MNDLNKHTTRSFTRAHTSMEQQLEFRQNRTSNNTFRLQRLRQSFHNSKQKLFLILCQFFFSDFNE